MIPRVIHSRPWASSLRYRDFRLFWASTLCYSLGTGMEAVAVGWLVFEITGSAFMVGVAAAARMAPLFFLGILSGAMADWLERRLFLFFSALGGVTVAAAMAAILLTGNPSVWAVIALVAAGGCVFAFTLTVVTSIPRSLAIFAAISRMCGAIFGCCAMIVESILPMV